MTLACFDTKGGGSSESKDDALTPSCCSLSSSPHRSVLALLRRRSVRLLLLLSPLVHACLCVLGLHDVARLALVVQQPQQAVAHL